MADLSNESIDYSKLINLDRLQLFGERTIVPMNGTIATLAQAVGGLSNGVEKISDSIAPEETSPAQTAHAAGVKIMFAGTLYKTKTNIAIGDTLTPTVNIEEIKVTEITDAQSAQISNLANNVSANTTAIGKAYKSDDTAETTMDDADYIPFYDTSAGTTKKISKSNANFGGGGSTINLTTGDDGLLGQSVTISDGVTTLTGTFSNAGECTFKGVQLIGTLTITATVEGTTVSDTLSVPYFGVYDKGFGRGGKTISISTAEATLIGKTVTATYDTSKTKTATISALGTATITIYSYTGAVTISATDGEDTAEVNLTLVAGTDEYTATLAFSHIYGVSWDGSSSPVMTRTDAAASFVDPVPQMSDGNGGWTAGSSPFDTISPWKDMEIVDDANAGKLVKIPKYYYKWTKTGAAMTLQISTKQETGFLVSPAHADRGDGTGERDFVYVGRYHCASDYKSKTGVTPKNNDTRANMRSGIHNLGSDIWQYDFAMWWTINMLYLVEFANWNSQATIGYGRGNGSAVGNMGYTDSMTYHTGTTQTSRTTYGLGTQYRYIEGLWDNVYDWCDGIYFAGTSNLDVYAIKNPASFSDSSGGTKIGTRPNTSNNIKAWSIPSVSGFEYALYPSEVVSDSNYETYICDHCGYYSSGVVLCVGGGYDQYQNSGAFYLYGYNSASVKYAHIGCRLQKLPA